MADTQSILQLGIEAARSGDKAEARELFRLVTREDPNNVQGWLWLAGVAEDRDEKRSALEHVLQIEPNNDLARKGLSALGGASAAATTSAIDASRAPAPAAPPAPSVAAAPSAPSGDQDLADSFDSIDDYAANEQGTRSRTYDQPDQPDQGGAYVPPDFGDDFDLSEYQNQPRAAAPNDAADDQPTTTVVVDEEDDNRRRGVLAFWPLLLVLVLICAVIGYALWTRDSGTVATTPGGDPNAAASASNGAAGGTDGSGAPAASDGSSNPGGLLPSDAAGSPAPDSSAAPVDGSPAPDGSAPPVEGSPAPDGSAAPVDGSPAPDASAPPAEASAPPAGEASAPPVVAPPDVASANPAVVANEQVLTGGQFQYRFSGLNNASSRSYGTPPTQGRYLIVLMLVGNSGDQPVQIPDDFFVVKDAQGRTYTFNRAASVAYLNAFGGTGPRGAGDYAADATLQPGAPLGSMPLLFDVATDATNLVLFSRDNVNQGFLVRDNVQ